MRAEKQILTKEYAARLNGSPFFIVVGYQGLKVSHLTELRKRLKTAGAEVHVVKNSVFLIAAKEAGVAELNGSLAGQMAVVTGQKDISAAAKALTRAASRAWLSSKGEQGDELAPWGDLALLPSLRCRVAAVALAAASAQTSDAAARRVIEMDEVLEAKMVSGLR